MNGIALAIRLLLAGVLAAAAAAKFADRTSARDALGAFGVPAALTAPVAALLIGVELAIAIALLVPAAAWFGAAAATALFSCFAVALTVSVATGRQAPCHCFGRLHTAPAGPRALARTAALAILAGVLLAAGPARTHADPMGWATALSSTEAIALGLTVTLIAAVAAGALLYLSLAAQNGRLVARLETLERQLQLAPHAVAGATDGLPVGAPAPAFSIECGDDCTTLAELCAAGAPVIAVFSSPDCGPCRALAPDIAAWQRDHAHHLTVVVVDGQRETARAYGAHGTPSAVAIAQDGTIASRLAIGAHAIADLVTASAHPPPAVTNGQRHANLAVAGAGLHGII